jgi:hypothetical protein
MARDDCPIRGGHPRVPLSGRHRGRANPVSPKPDLSPRNPHADPLRGGFLADRIAAATTAWRLHLGARIEEHGLRFSTDIHFMLSRATQTP